MFWRRQQTRLYFIENCVFFFLFFIACTMLVCSPTCQPAKPIVQSNPPTNKQYARPWPQPMIMMMRTIIAWGFALIWITLSCKWGYAKPINDLLSYRPMLPLSRLTYCAYLIHPVTQIVMSFQLKGPVHIQHALVLTIFMGNAIISYTCALVLSLMFEAPVVRMLKILFGR